MYKQCGEPPYPEVTEAQMTGWTGRAKNRSSQILGLHMHQTGRYFHLLLLLLLLLSNLVVGALFAAIVDKRHFYTSWCVWILCRTVISIFLSGGTWHFCQSPISEILMAMLEIRSQKGLNPMWPCESSYGRVCNDIVQARCLPWHLTVPGISEFCKKGIKNLLCEG